MSFRLLQALPAQYEDASGNPLVGGTIEAFLWNTTTPTPLYSDESGTVIGVTVSLNSRGEPQTSGGTAVQLFGNTAITQGYKLVRKDADGAVIPPTLGPIYNQFTPSDVDASDVLFSHDETYPAGSVGYRLTQTINITDAPYNAPIGIAGTINAALTAIFADLTDYAEIYIPPGDFYIDGSGGAARVPNGLNAPGYSTPTLFTITGLTYLKFGGPGRLICSGTNNYNLFDFVNIESLDLDSLNIQGNAPADPTQTLFFGQAGDLVRVRGSGGSFTKRLRVHNCDIGRAPISPLRVMRAVSDAVITSNTFYDNTSTIRFGEDVVGLPAAQRPRRFVFDGNTVSNTLADACVEVRYIAQDVSISNNTLRTYPGDDVFEYINDNIALVGQPVHTQGISVRGGPAGRGYVRNINIAGNTIRAISDGGYVARGITLLDSGGNDYAEDCLITTNDIEGVVVIYGAGNSVRNNKILGNVTKDNATGNVSIKANEITVPPAVTVAISVNSAANPTIVTTTTNHNLLNGDTVRISGSNSTPTIDGDRTATVLGPNTFSVAVNVTVAGGAGTVKHDFDTKAIFTAAGDYQLNIEDNEIFSDADTTILTASANKQIVRGNTLNFTGAATGNLNAAIRSVTGNSVTISENTVVNADGSGIVLASVNGATSMATLAGNHIHTAGNRGIQVLSGVNTGVVHVRGNDVGTATNGAWQNQGTSALVYVYDDNSFVIPAAALSDAAATLTAGTSARFQILDVPITVARTITLSTTSAFPGAKFRFIRTAAATGAFDLNIGAGTPLKALVPGTWCEVEYVVLFGWMLKGYGTL